MESMILDIYGNPIKKKEVETPIIEVSMADKLTEGKEVFRVQLDTKEISKVGECPTITYFDGIQINGAKFIALYMGEVGENFSPLLLPVSQWESILEHIKTNIK